MDISKALEELEKLKDKPKYEAMMNTTAIITKLLEPHKIQPIIVGGLSVEIYTQNDYTTRDIDIVAPGRHIIEEILISLNFIKKGRHFYREDIEVVIEIPDNYLAGDKNKVIKAYMDEDDDKYVYIISKEDIILDRVRATLFWESEDDEKWAFNIFSKNFHELDIKYLIKKTENKKEEELIRKWIKLMEESNL